MQHTIDFSNVAEISIVYSSHIPSSQRPEIRSSRDAYDKAMELWPAQIEHREAFVIMLLNRANKVLGFSTISVGGLTGTVVDVRIIYQTALKANANSMILFHNHPSGNTQPSDTDIKLTDKIKRAGEILDIQVLDHLIITPEKYYSFADEARM